MQDAPQGKSQPVLHELGTLLEQCRKARLDLSRVLDRLSWLDEQEPDLAPWQAQQAQRH